MNLFKTALGALGAEHSSHPWIHPRPLFDFYCRADSEVDKFRRPGKVLVAVFNTSSTHGLVK